MDSHLKATGGIPLCHPILLLFFFLLFRAALAAYEGSQARGGSRVVATSLHHSHSHTGSSTR